MVARKCLVDKTVPRNGKKLQEENSTEQLYSWVEYKKYFKVGVIKMRQLSRFK